MITNIGEDMRYLIIGILGFLLSSCASIGAVIDSGKEVATGLLDMTVGTASKVVSAVAEDVADTTAFVADTTAGTLEDVAEKVLRHVTYAIVSCP